MSQHPWLSCFFKKPACKNFIVADGQELYHVQLSMTCEHPNIFIKICQQKNLRNVTSVEFSIFVMSCNKLN